MAPQMKGIAYKAQRPMNKAEKLKKQQQKLMIFNQRNSIGNNKNGKSNKGKTVTLEIFKDLEDGIELNDEDQQKYSSDEDEESMKDILNEGNTLEEGDSDNVSPEEFSSLKNNEDEFPHIALRPKEKKKLKLSKKKRDLLKGNCEANRRTFGNGCYKIVFTEDKGNDDNDEGSLMCTPPIKNQKSFKEELIGIAAGKHSRKGKGRSWR